MLKVLGNGKVDHPLNITAHKVSESARAAIEQAGGSVTLIAMRETVKTRRSGKEPPKF
jgi:large subunit ribosomal protein L15